MMKIMQMKMRILREILDRGKNNNEIIPSVETDALLHIVLSAFRMQMFKWKMALFSI